MNDKKKSILSQIDDHVDAQIGDVDPGVKLSANKDGAKLEGDIEVGKGVSVGGWVGYYWNSTIDWVARLTWKPKSRP